MVTVRFAVVAYLSLAAAMPTNMEPVTDEVVRDVMDALESRESLESFNSLDKRLSVQDLQDWYYGDKWNLQFKYRNELPDCTNADPSYDMPKTVSYAPDTGVKIPPKGRDPCDSGKSNRHCWTEYWLVNHRIETSDWVNSGAAIDCASTYTCNSDTAMQNRTCKSTKWSNTHGFDASLEVKIKEKFSPKGAYSFRHESGGGVDFCTQEGTINRCTWNDQKCHQVWVADRIRRVYGYMQRTCASNAGVAQGTTVQQNTEIKNGDRHVWVRGQTGFSFAVPMNRIIGCNALCKDNSYKDPIGTSGPDAANLETVDTKLFQ